MSLQRELDMKIVTATNRIARFVVAIAFAFGVAAHAAAQEPHKYASGAATHALKLNAGHKWETDAPLRQGMIKIRAAVEPRLEAVHAGTLTTREYQALGAEVQGQLADIVRNCKLDAQADEVLHVILADVTEGADALQGHAMQLTPRAGALKILAALDTYGHYFDHPGWLVLK